MLGSNNSSHATIYLILAPVSLSLMGFAVKEGSLSSISLLLFARFAISALDFSLWLGISGYAFRRIRPFRHLLRTFFGLCSVACLFSSINLIPLSTALCLSYTVPVFAYLISIIRGENNADIRVLFIAGATVGIVLILQPSAAINTGGIFLGLASAIFGALALFEIKRISETEDSEAILFMYFLYSTIVLFLLILFRFNFLFLKQHIASSFLILIAIGIFGLLYQLCLVKALQFVSVEIVAMSLLGAVAIGYVIDIVFLDDNISAWSVAGTVLLAICVGAFNYAGREQ